MFSFKKLNNHYDNGLLKDHPDAKEYFEKFMCPLTNVEHAIFEDGRVTIIPEVTMKNGYLNRFPDDIKSGIVRFSDQRNSSVTLRNHK